MLKTNFNFYRYGNSTYYGTTGYYDIPEGWDCCFGEFTKDCSRDIRLSQEFNITLWKLNSKVMTEQGHNNVCLFNIKEIIEHLKEIQNICKFEYKVIQYKDRYVINFYIDAYALYIKFVLTWIRLLYEYPHNVLYCEAKKLSKLPAFADMNLLSIYNLVCSTMYTESYCSYENNFIYSSRFTEPITYEELKKRIEEFIKEDVYWINQLFTITENEGLVVLPDLDYSLYDEEMTNIIYGYVPLKKVETPLKKYYKKGSSILATEMPSEDNKKYKRYKYYGDISPYEYKYWTSIRNFNQRLKAYTANLEILNNYLKNKK